MNTVFFNLKLALVLLLFVAIDVSGQIVTMPNIIGNNMVLQQNTNVPLWGWAASGTKIDITPSWGQKTTVFADASGKWTTNLQTPVAISGQAPTYTITVAGPSNTINFSNILVGEVWLTSGQSNMAFAMNFLDSHTNLGVLNYASEIADANYPNIRFFDVPKASSASPLSNCNAAWVSCSPATVARFSAVAYYFSRHLYQHTGLNVPIGIINASYSGSAIQRWIKKSVISSDPALNTKYGSGTTSDYYNAMIAPIIPFAIKGALWYQGETNVGDGAIYSTANSAMLNDWRNDWGTNFSFYATQLSPRLSTPGQFDTGYGRAEFREIQSAIRSLAKADIIPNGDNLINSQDLYHAHPRDKKTVGTRLALMALAKDYEQAVQHLGPIYQSHTISGNSIIISFRPESLGSGLGKGKGLTLNCFRISGNDKNFYTAIAQIVGNTVVVSSPNVPSPVAVRYAFTDGAMTNFQNNDGIAAYPFKTDNWTTVTNISAPVNSPFIVTTNNGIQNTPFNYFASTGCTVNYIQNPDKVTNDTVMQFVRNTNASNSYVGPQWNKLNNEAGVDIGPYIATQYQYLIVRAKQSSATRFFINLQHIGDSVSVKTADIASLIQPVANEWKDYVFDLSSGSRIPGTFLMLMLMPEKGQASATTLISSIYFTNDLPLTAFPASKVQTPTYARTATTIDLNWLALTSAVSYNVLNQNDVVVKSGILTNSTVISELNSNTTYTFKVVGVNEADEQSRPSASVTAITRKQKGANFELIEDFEAGVSPFWIVSSKAAGSFNPSTINAVTNGINSSAKCGRINILLNGNQRTWNGLQVSKERIDVGPNAPFRYLHVKMYRDQDIGGFTLNLLPRTDIVQAQLNFNIPYSAKMTDGNWYDYVFDLKSVSSTDLSYYDFLIRVNTTSGNPTKATNTYFDDFVLSNDATPMTSNVRTVNLTLNTNNASMGTVTGGGLCLKGISTTISASPLEGIQFLNWSNGSTIVSTSANYTFLPIEDIELTANFASPTGINNIAVNTSVTISNRNLIFEGDDCNVELFDLIGKLVLSKNVSNSTITLNQAGIYLLKMNSVQGVKFQKIIVK